MEIRGSTILCVRREGHVVLAGDGQVTMNNVILKANARKVRDGPLAKPTSAIWARTVAGDMARNANAIPASPWTSLQFRCRMSFLRRFRFRQDRTAGPGLSSAAIGRENADRGPPVGRAGWGGGPGADDRACDPDRATGRLHLDDRVRTLGDRSLGCLRGLATRRRRRP